MNSKSLLSQVADNDYGKTILISRTGPARIWDAPVFSTRVYESVSIAFPTSGAEAPLATRGSRAGGDGLNLLVAGLSARSLYCLNREEGRIVCMLAYGIWPRWRMDLVIWFDDGQLSVFTLIDSR